MALLLFSIGLLAVSVYSQAGGVSVEVVAGEDVTLWCRHGLTDSDHLFWCKHTNNSVPVYIGCRFYSVTLPSNRCNFIAVSESVEMGVNSENSSLTIRSVHHSDSGLYYCSTLNQKYMIYSSATYLQIRDKVQSSSVNHTNVNDYFYSGVFFGLLLVFGILSLVLLVVLLILQLIVVKNLKQQRKKERYQGGSDNYTPLHFSKKKNRS